MEHQNINNDALSKDPRILKTRLAVCRTVLNYLSQGRTFDSLTISEVAAAAGVTRKTLYARFGSLEQVVQEIAFEMFTNVVATIDDEDLRGPTIEHPLTIVVFRALESEKNTLVPLITMCSSSLVIEPAGRVFRQLLDRIIEVNHHAPLTSFQRDYLTAIVGSTVHGMMRVWIQRNFVDSADELAALFIGILGPGFEVLMKDSR